MAFQSIYCKMKTHLGITLARTCRYILGIKLARAWRVFFVIVYKCNRCIGAYSTDCIFPPKLCIFIFIFPLKLCVIIQKKVTFR